MSGNSRQGGQGGQQPPQGRQQGGGQPQAGQQPRGQAGQPPQGGGRPQQRGGGGGIDTSAVLNTAVWIIVAMAVAGVALGLFPLLYGSVGGEAVDTVDANDTTREENAQEIQNAEDNLTSSESNIISSWEEAQFNNNIVGLVLSLSPYLAFLLAIVLAVIAAVVRPMDVVNLSAALAVAAVVGVLLFMVLSMGIAGFQSETFEQDQQIESGDIENPEQFETVKDDRGLFGDVDKITVSWGDVILNGLLIGVTTAIGAAGIGVAVTRLRD
jgi:hypothetical protein